PEHLLKVLGRFAEPLAKFTSTGEGCHGLARARPLRGDEARPQDQFGIQLGSVPILAHRQSAGTLDSSLQMRNGLKIGRTQSRVLAGLEPVSDRLLDQSGFGQMMRQGFGLRFHYSMEPL